MGLAVVLVRARNPLNIGAVARAMSNFGVEDLRCVGVYEPSFREANSAVDARAVMQSSKVFDSLERALADMTFVVGTTATLERLVTLTPLDVAAESIRAEMASGNVAILFGSEKTGLSREELSYCHLTVRIPTRPQHGSMNLGQAAAVVLYELTRGSSENKPTNTGASGEELSRLENVWMDVLRTTEYMTPQAEEATSVKLRQLLRRMSLSANDAVLLTGMWRRVAGALKRR